MSTRESDMPELSVVIPFFNEVEVAPPLLAELRATMDALDRTHEVVLVDDGSTDGTGAQLATIAAAWAAVRVITLAKNSGQGAALLRGFREACGAWIITLDGDGQNVPADIPELLKLVPAHDMVVGIRVARKDSRLRRSMARVANSVRGRFLRDGLHDSGCALKIFRREVVESFLPIKSLYSFMPAFAVAAGFRITEIPVRHRERRAGLSKYGLRVFAWRPLADMLAIWWFNRRRIDTRKTPAP